MMPRLALILGLVFASAVAAPSQDKAISAISVTSAPASLQLAPFYKKYVGAEGIPIVGSVKPPDAALLAAADIVRHMLAQRADICDELVKAHIRVAVMASTEQTTNIPEHSDLKPKQNWDKRARGLGATTARPAVSCAEENLLGYEGDRYLGESILIHEFAHTVHEIGLCGIEKDFDARLKALYDKAMKKGLWAKTYAAQNYKEYWAEGVQSWFDANLRAVPPNGIHNHVCTRESLERYDPELAQLIAEIFCSQPWRWTRPSPTAVRVAESWKMIVQGNDAFTSAVAGALALLKTRSPDSYQTLNGYIAVIKQGKHSAAWAYRNPPTIELADTTALYSVTWLAGVLVHEAQHSKLYHDHKKRNADRVADEVWIGREAEKQCLARQLQALQDIGAPANEIDYCRKRDGDHFDVDKDGKYDWKDFANRKW